MEINTTKEQGSYVIIVVTGCDLNNNTNLKEIVTLAQEGEESDRQNSGSFCGNRWYQKTVIRIVGALFEGQKLTRDILISRENGRTCLKGGLTGFIFFDHSWLVESKGKIGFTEVRCVIFSPSTKDWRYQSSRIYVDNDVDQRIDDLIRGIENPASYDDLVVELESLLSGDCVVEKKRGYGDLYIHKKPM